MLAFMPRSTPPHSHMSTSMLESRTALTLLPSTPMSYSQPQLPAALSLSPSPSKKPKLSLNTSDIAPIFGKGATSLRLETLSATSPTSIHTFRNGRARESVLTPLTTDIETPLDDSPTPSQMSLPDSASTTETSRSRTTSVTSVSTDDSSPSEAPYKLPFNATSILTNGPIPRTKSGRFSVSQLRPMFPTPKKVAFHATLTEEIKTNKYTLRHSDIEVPLKEAEARGEVEEQSKDSEETAVTSPSSGFKRDVADVEDEETGHLTTPVAGRAKRHRWVWTLPPVQPGNEASAVDVINGVSA